MFGRRKKPVTPGPYKELADLLDNIGHRIKSITYYGTDGPGIYEFCGALRRAAKIVREAGKDGASDE